MGPLKDGTVSLVSRISRFPLEAWALEGSAAVLFSPSALGLELQNPVANFCIDPAGERFLFVRVKPPVPGASENRAEPITRLNLVTNWFEELRAKVPMEE